jgi:hypothetical protein
MTEKGAEYVDKLFMDYVKEKLDLFGVDQETAVRSLDYLVSSHHLWAFWSLNRSPPFILKLQSKVDFLLQKLFENIFQIPSHLVKNLN